MRLEKKGKEIVRTWGIQKVIYLWSIFPQRKAENIPLKITNKQMRFMARFIFTLVEGGVDFNLPFDQYASFNVTLQRVEMHLYRLFIGTSKIRRKIQILGLDK